MSFHNEQLTQKDTILNGILTMPVSSKEGFSFSVMTALSPKIRFSYGSSLLPPSPASFLVRSSFTNDKAPTSSRSRRWFISLYKDRRSVCAVWSLVAIGNAFSDTVHVPIVWCTTHEHLATEPKLQTRESAQHPVANIHAFARPFHSFVNMHGTKHWSDWLPSMALD